MLKIHLSEARAERIADHMVAQAEATDPRCTNAENYDELALALDCIENEVWDHLESKYIID